MLKIAADKNNIVTGKQIEEAELLAESIANLTVRMAEQREVMKEREQAERDQARAIEDVIDSLSDAILHARSFKDALRNIALVLAEIILTGSRGGDGKGGLAGILTKVIGGVIGGVVVGGGGKSGGTTTKSAMGNAFSGGRVVPFASGGVIDGPANFQMRRGIGLMGEAGPEAIMPLKRGPGGKLGVEASGGSGTIIVEQTNNFAVGIRGEVRAGIEEQLPRIVNAAKLGVHDAAQRGGKFPRAFG
jgi:phage-related minor tail protein